MFTGMDSVGVGIAPERNDFSPAAFYFIAWLLVGTFTTLNLFVGSVVDNFTRIKQEQEWKVGGVLMTPEQRQWVRTMREASQNEKPALVPKAPTSKALLPFYNLVTSKEFDFFITAVIISNILVMALDFHHIEEYPGYYNFYTGALQLFTYIYYSEATLKLLGLGVPTYFRDVWNRFDFFLVCTSLLDQFAAEALAAILPVPPGLMRMLRVLRIMRILRLLKGFKGLRDLLMTMVLSFPSFINVGGLLALVTFIYAVLGVQLFTYVMEGEVINDQLNFVSFGSAYLLLIQVLTGDNWSGLMYDCMVGPERGCDPNAVPTDCGNSMAIPYFTTYTIVGTFVLLNLVVAVILENFTALGDVNPDLVSANDIADFGEIWGMVDDEQSGMVTDDQLAQILLIMPPPLGLAGLADEAKAKDVVQRLSVKRIDGQWLKFGPTTDALIRRSYEEKEVAAVPEAVSDLREGGGGGDLEVSLPQTPGSYYGSPNGNGYHQLIDSYYTTSPPSQMTGDVRNTLNTSVRRPTVKHIPSDAELPTPVPLPPPSPNGYTTPSPEQKRLQQQYRGLRNSASGGGTPAPPRPPPGAPPPLPGGWRCVNTPSGSYYYNTGTRQVSWQPPIEWLRSLERRANGSPEVKA